MKKLILVVTTVSFFLAGCSSFQAQTGVGGVATSNQFDMTEAYADYYNAVKLQNAPVQIVDVGLDTDGRVNSFKVFQMPDQINILPPEKSYSPGWKSLDSFTSGMWDAVKFAVPGAATWAVADSINKYSSNAGPVVNDSFNNDTRTDNSNQRNPVDNAAVE